MKFNAPCYLFLLVIPVLLAIHFVWANRRRTRDLCRLAAADLLPKIVPPVANRLRTRGAVWRIFAILFLALAITGPQWGYRWREVKSRGLEIIFALDASKSMLASDIKPTRFDRGKLALKDFLAKINGNRVGLIAFAGAGFLQCPLTTDYTAFGMALDGLTVHSIPRGGTLIGTAIANARRAFKSATGNKILILITDGENHEGQPVVEAEKAAQEGIHIYTVGIGSPEGALIKLPDQNGNLVPIKDDSGNPVKTALNEEILKAIARAGNGAYIRADDFSLGLEKLYHNQLLKYYQTELSSKKQKQYIDRYQIPLFLAFLFLLAELSAGYDSRGWLKSLFSKLLHFWPSGLPGARR
ncbi:MAG: vWA domain-containing protein [Bacillota bacterium]